MIELLFNKNLVIKIFRMILNKYDVTIILCASQIEPIPYLS